MSWNSLTLGIFIAHECQQHVTVCPKHGDSYGIRWRTGKTKCCVSTEVARHETTSKAPVIWSRVPETTLPTSYPGRVNFSLCCWRQTVIYMNVPELSRGSRQLGWTSCLTSAGRVNRTTFLHINALARLTGTTLDPDSNRGDRGMDSKRAFFKKPACLFQLDRVCGAVLWNSLPSAARQATSLTSFRRLLINYDTAFHVKQALI